MFPVNRYLTFHRWLRVGLCGLGLGLILLPLFGAATPRLLHAAEDSPDAAKEKEISSKDVVKRGQQKPLSKRWIPSVAFQPGLFLGELDGSLETRTTPAAAPTPTLPVFPSIVDDGVESNLFTGDDVELDFNLAINIELATPELPLPLKPRLFIGAEVVPFLSNQRIVAGFDDPGELGSPFPPEINNTAFNAEIIAGRGAELRSEVSEIGWGAYIGMQFPFEIFDRKVRIKPRVSWLRFRIEGSSVTSAALCNTPQVPQPPFAGIPPADACNAPLTEIREIENRGSTSQTFHAIGPGLDIELEAYENDHVAGLVYAGFRPYRTLGDRTIDFAASETFTDGFGTGDVTSTDLQIETEAWTHRFVAGFRIEWRGGIPGLN